MGPRGRGPGPGHGLDGVGDWDLRTGPRTQTTTDETAESREDGPERASERQSRVGAVPVGCQGGGGVTARSGECRETVGEKCRNDNLVHESNTKDTKKNTYINQSNIGTHISYHTVTSLGIATRKLYVVLVE